MFDALPCSNAACLHCGLSFTLVLRLQSLQGVGQTRFPDALGKLLKLMFLMGRERQWQRFGGVHTGVPPGYCIKCITCCFCFPAVTAVQFPPYKLNSNPETCLEKSPWPCVMLALVPGTWGPAQGWISWGSLQEGSAQFSVESAGACCTGLGL